MKNINILLVEDDHTIAELLTLSLQAKQCNVDWHAHGTKGFEAANNDNYDLILLDLNLPGMHGIDILKNIRENGQTTPIICMTSEDSYENRMACLGGGANVFIGKPFDLDELLQHVQALTE